MASTRIAGAHVHATHLAPKSKFVPRGEEDIVPKDTATIVDWQPRRSRKDRDATNRTASFWTGASRIFIVVHLETRRPLEGRDLRFLPIDVSIPCAALGRVQVRER